MNILVLNPADRDSDSILNRLTIPGYECKLMKIATKDEYINWLESFQPDVILSDFNLDNFDGLEALKILRTRDTQTPFIFVSDTLTKENAVEAIRSGATDLVVDNHFQELPAAILRTVRKNEKAKTKLIPSKQAVKAPGITYRCLADKEWTMQFVSDEIQPITGYPPGDFTNNRHRTYASIIHPDDRDNTYLILDRLDAGEAFSLEYRIVCADGTLRWVEDRGIGVFDENNLLQFIDGVILDVTDKKKANDKFQAIFDQTTEAIFLIDEHGNYIDFNKAAIKLFGYNRKELSKMNVAQLMGLSWDENFTKYWQAFLDKEKERGTLSLPTKKGSMIHVSHISVANILPNVHLSIINNISEKVQQEAQLLASERKFKALVQEGSDLLSILDLDGNYLFVSESSRIAVLGFKPQDMVGRNAFEFVHPDDKETVFKQFSLLKDNKQVNISPFRFRDVSNHWHMLTTTATNLLDDPAVGGIVANSRDITETILQKEALKVSNERFELAMRAANEMIWDWDINTDKVTRGRGFGRIFGFHNSELKTHPNFWMDKIHEEDLEATKQSIDTALKNIKQEKWEKEYRIVKNNGEIAYIVDRGYIVRDEKGKAERVVGAVSDITKSREMLHEISEQNKLLKEIAWTQSHIVRAPLARLLGLVELLKTEVFDLSNQKEILENIGNSAEELDTIIRDIVGKADQLERKQRHGIESNNSR